MKKIHQHLMLLFMIILLFCTSSIAKAEVHKSTFELKKTSSDCVFTIEWDVKEANASITLISPSGVKYDNTYEKYEQGNGLVNIYFDEAEAGEWQIIITGDGLGNVKVVEGSANTLCFTYGEVVKLKDSYEFYYEVTNAKGDITYTLYAQNKGEENKPIEITTFKGKESGTQKFQLPNGLDEGEYEFSVQVSDSKHTIRSNCAGNINIDKTGNDIGIEVAATDTIQVEKANKTLEKGFLRSNLKWIILVIGIVVIIVGLDFLRTVRKHKAKKERLLTNKLKQRQEMLTKLESSEEHFRQLNIPLIESVLKPIILSTLTGIYSMREDLLPVQYMSEECLQFLQSLVKQQNQGCFQVAINSLNTEQVECGQSDEVVLATTCFFTIGNNIQYIHLSQQFNFMQMPDKWQMVYCSGIVPRQ